MVARLEDLFQSLYFYFSSSPKWHLEFIKLANIVKTRGLKNLEECQDKVNINIGAFEMCLSKIQNNDYQNVTKQHWNFSSKIEF
jgi:hypothetical protein